MPDQMTPREKMSADDRRAMTLRALSGANKVELAAEFGVSRRWVYDLLEDATADPEGKVAEAERELYFRRQVKEILDRREPRENG